MKKLAIAALLLFTGFMISAQNMISVSINADAPNATVLVDNSTTLKLPATIPLTVGSHNFTVSAPGYKTKTMNVPIMGNMPGGLMIKMEKLPGFTLTVNVTNAPNPTITVNNGSFANGSVLNPGTYLLKVSAPGFKDFQTMVNLTSGNQVLPVTLESNTVTLTVQVLNAKAYQILINNGPAQTINNLAPGSYLLTVKAPGFKDFQTMVNLTGSQTIPVTLEGNSVSLTIQVLNAKAYQIFINNGPGKTINNLAPGSYLVKVTAPGYKDFQTMVTLSGSQTLPVTLEANTVSLTVQVLNAASYQILINNGPAQAVNNLAPGSYLVTVKAPGFKDFQTMVNLTGPQTLPVTLESLGASVNVDFSKVGKAANAKVYVNNVVQKSLPFTATGTVIVRVEVGQIKFETTAVLEAGRSYTITPTPMLILQ